ncbi:MAG: hypothetical protein MI924_00275 [Chloroflexales bacterium]|nr:hypothetical protein [Chloroflexales bacterium]
MSDHRHALRISLNAIRLTTQALTEATTLDEARSYGIIIAMVLDRYEQMAWDFDVSLRREPSTEPSA